MSENHQDESAEHVGERPVGREEVIATALKAAGDLFACNNPSQVSVREIAHRAGVSHALVHRYLGSKDDIFRAVVAAEEKRVRALWAGIGDVADAPTMFEEGGSASARLMQILLRARLEGIVVEGSESPVSERVLALLAEHPIELPADDPGFDPRLVLMVAMAASASMWLSHDFFIESSGLRGMDRETFHAEFSRLLLHILSLAKRP